MKKYSPTTVPGYNMSDDSVAMEEVPDGKFYAVEEVDRLRTLSVNMAVTDAELEIENKKLRSIVLNLKICDEPILEGHGVCILCGGYPLKRDHEDVGEDQKGHAADCPWACSQEAV